jgi:hypothetical protein
VLCAEKFNLFSLDQREVLTWMNTFPKVPVAWNSHSALNRDVLTLNLSHTALWANEDTFNDHRVLLIAVAGSCAVLFTVTWFDG